MSLDALLTFVVLAVMVWALARELAAPSATVLTGVIVLLVAGVITPAEAFAGLSNPAPITVAALYVLARAVEKTGALQPLVAGTLGAGDGRSAGLARLLIPAAAMSSLLNNTPIVAMLAPQVENWAQRTGLSPSRFLMPLSFAAILGGMVTLIGTSTNLVVSGLLIDAGEPPLTMFELTPVGLPVAVVGVGLLILLSPRLLPERHPAQADLSDGFREFVVRMIVEADGALDGRSVEAGRLRNLAGVFLIEIDRQGEVIAPVGPHTVLRGGDELTFVGRADVVVDLHAIRGLVSAEHKHVQEFDTVRHTFFEAVLGPSSPLVGRSLKEAGFRAQYQAAVVAIHRAGRRIDAKLGGIGLKAEDTLLILSDPGFRDRWRDRSAFLLVSRLGGVPPAVGRKAWIVALVGAGVVVSAAVGLLPVLSAALVGALVLVMSGVLTPSEAKGAIDLDVILVIAGAFGLAAALETSGLAADVAQLIDGVFGTLGASGGLVGIVLTTVLLKSLITNNAAAVLMFPIAMSAATELELNVRAFAVAVALAASASFLTPLSYQTNLMVYGPGGYRFGDFARLGAPLVVLVVLATIVLVPWFWPLH
ncbi:MAG: SLC13 family permease [Acidobacteria bacterium]|nr:SLC13 family permease [Acidobacteriota bacterium]